MKKRLDAHLHEEGLFESRALACAAVMEGLVRVDGSTAVKPGTRVSGEETILVTGGGRPFVSRGGLKLEHALDCFGVFVEGLAVIDVGCSTGGFTDCVLSRGASRVIALDVGKGQLHWKLRQDPRVFPVEGLNARRLRPGDLPFVPDIAVVDVSFISLEKVLGPVFSVIREGGEVLALVKPQFEAGRSDVGKGGVVRESGVHREVLERFSSWLDGSGIGLLGLCTSPLKGPKGNVEFFTRLARGETSRVDADGIARAVAEAHGTAGGSRKCREDEKR